MNNDRNNQNWEEHKNQNPREESRGSKEETRNEQPDNRLKDGTNDFQNGDQEPTSERSSDLGNENKQV
ncbi:MAG TPA: hypothetical protein VNT20_21925 [Flavisolibacter sp.]|jgi:hypothetical protein|nr:hypothetical protein [Flavisolibacter sp.]